MIILFLQQIDAHGRMEDPPARNAAWRYGNQKCIDFFAVEDFSFRLGFNVPANYDDVGLNCGGLSIQKANGKFGERRSFRSI